MVYFHDDPEKFNTPVALKRLEEEVCGNSLIIGIKFFHQSFIAILKKEFTHSILYVFRWQGVQNLIVKYLKWTKSFWSIQRLSKSNSVVPQRKILLWHQQ